MTPQQGIDLTFIQERNPPSPSDGGCNLWKQQWEKGTAQTTPFIVVMNEMVNGDGDEDVGIAQSNLSL